MRRYSYSYSYRYRYCLIKVTSCSRSRNQILLISETSENGKTPQAQNETGEPDRRIFRKSLVANTYLYVTVSAGHHCDNPAAKCSPDDIV